MKFQYLAALAVAATMALSGCNKAEPPDKVEADVSKATQDAASADAKADQTRKDAEVQSANDMAKAKADAQTEMVDKQVAAVADQAVTETEGQTNIAIAKCKALNGDAQKQCIDQANAHLKEVKARADAAKSPGKSDSGSARAAGSPGSQ